MAMRAVYHFTKEGAFLGPGSMFVFASGLLLIAAGFAYALPKSANSRPHQQQEQQHEDPTEDETVYSMENANTPLLNHTGSELSEGSASSYGTEMPRRS